MSVPKIVRGKKLLVASVGVAAITYACSSNGVSSGNLVAPNVDGGSADSSVDEDALISSGNLIAPADSGFPEDSGVPDDSGAADGSSDAGTD